MDDCGTNVILGIIDTVALAVGCGVSGGLACIGAIASYIYMVMDISELC